jgi:hypothetical protein
LRAETDAKTTTFAVLFVDPDLTHVLPLFHSAPDQVFVCTTNPKYPTMDLLKLTGYFGIVHAY